MLKIVVIGGGTGLSILLRGLKEVTQKITAVVTVADDGGGSGVLREDLGMLPPGDIRNCILALANKEPILQDLFEYRFDEGRLKGQNFGNLMIAAMQGISDNFEDAIMKIADIFAITGEVFPVSEEPLVLYAKLSDGITVRGESTIPLESVKRGAGIEKIWLEPSDAYTSDKIVNHILEADIVILGPGSLYTSIIPNLLVDNLVTAVNRTSADVVYICNVMTQPGETDHYHASDHLKSLFKHTKLTHVDCLIVNDGRLESDQIERYLKEDSSPVYVTESCREWFKSKSISVYEDNYIEIKKGYVRHNALKIARKIEQFYKTKEQSV
jgi:uncharacterized cofD-like protein